MTISTDQAFDNAMTRISRELRNSPYLDQPLRAHEDAKREHKMRHARAKAQEQARLDEVLLLEDEVQP